MLIKFLNSLRLEWHDGVTSWLNLNLCIRDLIQLPNKGIIPKNAKKIPILAKWQKLQAGFLKLTPMAPLEATSETQALGVF